MEMDILERAKGERGADNFIYALCANNKNYFIVLDSSIISRRVHIK